MNKQLPSEIIVGDDISENDFKLLKINYKTIMSRINKFEVCLEV